MSAPVQAPIRSPTLDRNPYSINPRTNTHGTTRSNFSIFSRTQSGFSEKNQQNMSIFRQPTPLQATDEESGLPQQHPPDVQPSTPRAPLGAAAPEHQYDENKPNFSLDMLRKVQQIEEKTYQALLILRQNIVVLGQLRQHYQNLYQSKGFPVEIASFCKEDIDRFDLSVKGAEDEMQMQILKLEYLLRLLGDRKVLVRISLGNPFLES